MSSVCACMCRVYRWSMYFGWHHQAQQPCDWCGWQMRRGVPQDHHGQYEPQLSHTFECSRCRSTDNVATVICLLYIGLCCALLLTMLCCAMLCYADLQAQAADRAADTGPGNAQAAAAAAAAWARQQWQQRWQQHGLGRGSGGCCSSSGSSWCGWQRYDSGSRSCASRDAAGSGAAAAAAGGVQQLHHCRCCSSNCVRSSCQPQQ